MLGERLRLLRLNAGIGLVELVERLGVAHSTVAGWESGRRVPDLRTLERLADIYGKSTDYLLGRLPAVAPSGMAEQGAEDPAVVMVPVLGRIRAGVPLLSEQNVVGEIAAPDRLAGKVDYALIVRGDSMSGAGVEDGDVVYLASADRRAPAHGDVVAALVGGADATLKWFLKRDGRWWLVAANPRYAPIPVDKDVSIQGVYVGLLVQRKLREFDPPLEDMPESLMIQRLSERKGIDPELLEDMLSLLARRAGKPR